MANDGIIHLWFQSVEICGFEPRVLGLGETEVDWIHGQFSGSDAEQNNSFHPRDRSLFLWAGTYQYYRWKGLEDRERQTSLFVLVIDKVDEVDLSRQSSYTTQPTTTTTHHHPT